MALLSGYDWRGGALVDLVHTGGRGLVAFSGPGPDGWQDTFVPARQGVARSVELEGKVDRFFSVGQFRRRRRRSDCVQSCGAIVVDLDRTDTDPEVLLADVLAFLHIAGVPEPSAIVDSGMKGLHLWWALAGRIPSRADRRRRAVAWGDRQMEASAKGVIRCVQAISRSGSSTYASGEESDYEHAGHRDAAPVTYGTDPVAQAANLDYAEMVVLARALEQWALSSDDLDPAARTDLVSMSVDLEIIADWVGPEWKALYPRHPPTVMKATARKLMRSDGQFIPMNRLFRRSEWVWSRSTPGEGSASESSGHRYCGA